MLRPLWRVRSVGNDQMRVFNSYHLIVHLGGTVERWVRSQWPNHPLDCLRNTRICLLTVIHLRQKIVRRRSTLPAIAISQSWIVSNSWSFHESRCLPKWTQQKTPRNGQGSAATWAGSTLWVRLRASPLSLATSCLHSVPGCGSLVLMKCTSRRFARWTWVTMIRSAITYRCIGLSHFISFTIASGL